MKKLTLEDSKTYQLGILDSIDTFCKSNNIKYSIAYGTLLGAVRHHGFIPWDDDIDIVMPREDYTRFVNLYQDSHYVLLTGDKIANHLHVVVTDPSTVVEFKPGTSDALFYRGGVWVDIFPLDKVPSSEDKFELLKKQIARRRIMQRYGELSPINKSDNVIKKGIKCIIHRILSLFAGHNGKAALRLMEKYKNEETDKVANLAVWYLKSNKSIPSEWLDYYVTLDFEGKSYQCFSQYHDYLVNLYGDYMKLPPPDERVPKHDYIAYRK